MQERQIPSGHGKNMRDRTPKRKELIRGIYHHQLSSCSVLRMNVLSSYPLRKANDYAIIKKNQDCPRDVLMEMEVISVAYLKYATKYIYIYISHPVTSRAQTYLASKIGQDRACSGWYGRRQKIYISNKKQTIKSLIFFAAAK